jgi:hypothetical protein
MNDAIAMTLLLLANVLDLSPSNQGKARSGLALQIATISANAQISVEMRNVSPKVIKLWKESNSWGSSHWRVLIVRNGRVQLFFQNPDTIFTRNGPAYIEVAAGGRVMQILDLNDDKWLGGTGEATTIKRGDTVIVLYDVPKQQIYREAPNSVAAVNAGVWYGVCADATEVR